MNQLKKNISIQSNKFGSECGLDGYYGDVLYMYDGFNVVSNNSFYCHFWCVLALIGIPCTVFNQEFSC